MDKAENRDSNAEIIFRSALPQGILQSNKFYYDELGTDQLEKFVNTILGTDFKTIDIKHQHVERGAVHNELDQLTALKLNPERIRLLYRIIDNKQFRNQVQNTKLARNTSNHSRELSLLLRDNLHRTHVFIINDIDVNLYFFQKKETKQRIDQIVLPYISF
ncbi:unnamed protein product [Adineta ricciae]|uniref:Uncharacterized protein n=1 Tax=Adineta ricciae TaxID=249248 RepID=A0A815RLP5_ADIRI|nr:unnamed protein product [Adineta ricciae]CAF1477526.1 unnamed protein product [Adineta ricciae]